MDVSKLSNTSVDELYGDIDDMYINQSNDVTVTQSDTTITSSTLSKVLPSNLSLPSSRNVTTDSDTVSTRNGETDEISQDINDVDFDLYDETIDEEQQCKNDTYNELKDKVEFLVAKLTELETENNILHQKTSKTEQEYIEAKRNIACLLLTTKGEIRRKDREIADLRKRLSVSPFQHKRKTRSSNLLSSIDSDLDTFSISGPDKASTPIKSRKSQTISSTKSNITDREIISSSDGERQSSRVTLRNDRSSRTAHSSYSGRSDSEETNRSGDRKSINCADYSKNSRSKRSKSPLKDKSAIDTKKSSESKRTDSYDKHDNVSSVTTRSDRCNKRDDSYKKERSRSRHDSSPSRRRKNESADDHRTKDSRSPSDLRSRLRGGEARVKDRSKDTSPHNRSRHKSSESKQSRNSNEPSETHKKKSEEFEKHKVIKLIDDPKPNKLSNGYNDAVVENDLSEGEISDSLEERPNNKSKCHNEVQSLVGSMKSKVQVVSGHESEEKSKRSTRSEDNRRKSEVSRKHAEEVKLDKSQDKESRSKPAVLDLREKLRQKHLKGNKKKDSVLNDVNKTKDNREVLSYDVCKTKDNREVLSYDANKTKDNREVISYDANKTKDNREVISYDANKTKDNREVISYDVYKTKDNREVISYDVNKTKDNREVISYDANKTKDNREVISYDANKTKDNREVISYDANKTKDNREVISYHEKDQLSKDTDVLELFDSESLDTDLECYSSELFKPKSDVRSSKIKNAEINTHISVVANNNDKSKSECKTKERKKSGQNLKHSLKEDVEFLTNLKTNISKESKSGKQTLMNDMEFLNKIKSSIRNETASTQSKSQSSSASKLVTHVERSNTINEKNSEKSEAVNEKVVKNDTSEHLDSRKRLKVNDGVVKNDSSRKKVDDDFDMYEDYISDVELEEEHAETETEHAKAETHPENMNSDSNVEMTSGCDNSTNKNDQCVDEEMSKSTSVNEIMKRNTSPVDKPALCGIANCTIKMRHLHPKQTCTPTVSSSKSNENSPKLPLSQSNDINADIPKFTNKSISKPISTKSCHLQDNILAPSDANVSCNNEGSKLTLVPVVSEVKEDDVQMETNNEINCVQNEGKAEENDNVKLNKSCEAFKVIEPVNNVDNADDVNGTETKTINEQKLVDESVDNESVGSFGSNIMSEKTGSWQSSDCSDSDDDSYISSSGDSSGDSSSDGEYSDTESSDEESDEDVSDVNESDHESFSMNNEKEANTPDGASLKPTSIDNNYKNTKELKQTVTGSLSDSSNVNCETAVAVNACIDKESKKICADTDSDLPKAMEKYSENTSNIIKSCDKDKLPASDNVSRVDAECSTTNNLSKKRDNAVSDAPEKRDNAVIDIPKNKDNAVSDVSILQQNESNLVTPANDELNISCDSNTSRSDMLQSLLKCVVKEFKHLKPERKNVDELITSEKEKVCEVVNNDETDMNVDIDEATVSANVQNSVDNFHKVANEKMLDNDTWGENMDDVTEVVRDKSETDKIVGIEKKRDGNEVTGVEEINDKNAAKCTEARSSKKEVKGDEEKSVENEVEGVEGKSSENGVKGVVDKSGNNEVRGIEDRISNNELTGIEQENVSKVDNVNDECDKLSDLSMSESCGDSSGSESDSSYSSHSSDCSTCSSHPSSCSTCSDSSSCSTCSGTSSSDCDSDNDSDDNTERISNENNTGITLVPETFANLSNEGMVCDNHQAAISNDNKITDHGSHTRDQESELQKLPTLSSNSSMPDKTVNTPPHSSNTISLLHGSDKKQTKKPVKTSETQTVIVGRSNKKVNKVDVTCNKKNGQPVLFSVSGDLGTSTNVTLNEKNPYLICDEQLNFPISPVMDEVLSKKKSKRKWTPRKHLVVSPSIRNGSSGVSTVIPDVNTPDLGNINSVYDSKTSSRKWGENDTENSLKSGKNEGKINSISDVNENEMSKNNSSENKLDSAKLSSVDSDESSSNENFHVGKTVNEEINNKSKANSINDCILTFSSLNTDLPHCDNKISSRVKKSTHNARKVGSSTDRKQSNEKSSGCIKDVEKVTEQILRRSPRKTCKSSSQSGLLSPKRKQKVNFSESKEENNEGELFWRSLSQNKHQPVGKKCYENPSEKRNKNGMSQPKVNETGSQSDTSTEEVRLKSTKSDQTSNRSGKTRNSLIKSYRNNEESITNEKHEDSCKSGSKTNSVNGSTVCVNVCEKVGCQSDRSSKKINIMQSKGLNNENTVKSKMNDRKIIEDSFIRTTKEQQSCTIVETIDNKTKKVCSRMKYTSTELTSPIKRFTIPKKKRKASTSPPCEKKKIPRKPLQTMSPMKSTPPINLKRTSDGSWSKIPSKTGLLQVSEVFGSSSSEDSSEDSSIVNALFGNSSPEKVIKRDNSKPMDRENRSKIRDCESSEKLVRQTDKTKSIKSTNYKTTHLNSANDRTKQVNSIDRTQRVNLIKGKTQPVKSYSDKMKDENSTAKNTKQIKSNDKMKQVISRCDKTKPMITKSDKAKQGNSADDKTKQTSDKINKINVTNEKMKEVNSSNSNTSNKTKPTKASLVLDLDEHTMDRIDYEDVLCLDECDNEFDDDTSDVTSDVVSDNNSDDSLEDGEICTGTKSDDENKQLTSESKEVALKEKTVDTNVKDDLHDKFMNSKKDYDFDKLCSDIKQTDRCRRKRSRDRRSADYRSRDRRRDQHRSRSPIDPKRRSRLSHNRDRQYTRDRNDSRDRRVRTPLKRRRSGSRHRDSDSSRSKRRNTSSRL